MKKKSIFNKILIAVISATICLSTVLTGVSAATTSIDINEDGAFDVSDSTHLQMYLAGYFDLSAEILEQADADNSASVDIGDVTRIQMLLAGYTFEENTTQPTTTQPTSESTSEPTSEPTSQPTSEPTSQPTSEPTSQPTTEPTTQPTQDFSAYVDEVIRLANIEREKVGVGPLAKRDDLCEIAQIRSVEASKYFSHIRPDGTGFHTIAIEKGISFRCLAENLARGQDTPEQAIREWMNSQGHRENMLNADYTAIGVGCYQSGDTLYWVQYFLG